MKERGRANVHPKSLKPVGAAWKKWEKVLALRHPVLCQSQSGVNTRTPTAICSKQRCKQQSEPEASTALKGRWSRKRLWEPIKLWGRKAAAKEGDQSAVRNGLCWGGHQVLRWVAWRARWEAQIQVLLPNLLTVLHSHALISLLYELSMSTVCQRVTSERRERHRLQGRMSI